MPTGKKIHSIVVICSVMSSHHFVREGQEPALLILEPINYSEAEGLLEWAPLVIVSEPALDDVLMWGIKIDVVLASEKRIELLMHRLMDQAPVKVFSGGDDFIGTALQLLTSIGQPALSIVAEHFSESIRERVERTPHRIQVTVRTASEKWSLIQAGIFKKWYQAGSIVNFLPQNFADTIPGLKKQENGYELVDDQWISIENPNPFWIGEFT